VCTPTNALRLLLASTLLVSWGCGLSRNAPAQQHYVLGGGSEPYIAAPAGESADSADAVIGLRPLRLAAYLETPFIVIRRAPHRVELSEFHRWGEELERGISRALGGHLAAGAPSWRVELAPWGLGVQPDYLIQIHLLRFEGVVPEAPGALVGQAHVQANWEILRRHDGGVLSRGTTDVRQDWTVGNFDALVSGLDQGLAALADALRADLERVLPPPGNP
jgi:uncharacterized protein